MSKVNQLKNKARREEQRENWSKAIELYTHALDTSRKEGEAFADLSLYNRIGDIYLRIGQKNTAVRYYEQAIERYGEQDLHTSAIALCNKVLRIQPERSTVFLQLGRLHLATNLIVDARAHYHRYAEAMRSRGSTTAAFESLEELIEETGDPQTLAMWATWLSRLPDRDEALERVEELRGVLIGHGVEPDNIIEQVRTGEIEGVESTSSMDAAPDPLAAAFLLTPDSVDPPDRHPLRDETETVVEPEAETVVETEAETVVEPEAETVVVPEPLELGSILWDDEAEELLAELNRPLEAAWAALGAEVHDAPPVHSTPLEIDSDLEVDERPGADAVTQSVGLDAPESADPPGEHQSEPPWRDARDLMELEAETTPMGHVDPDEGYELEAGEPNSTSYVDAVVGTDAPFDRWETLEPDALTPGDAGRADPPDLSFEAAELDTPAEPSVEEMGFSVEPPLVEDELPEPEAEEPVEPDLDASAAADVPYPDRFEYEDAAEGSEAPPVTADLGESYVTAFEGAETEDAGPDAWEDDALAAVEAANEPEPVIEVMPEPEPEPEPVVEAMPEPEPEPEPVVEVEPEPEPEPVVEVMPEPEPEPEPVVEVMPEPEPEPQIVFASGDPEIEVLPEPAPDPAGEVEIVDVADDVLPVVKNPFVPPDLPRPAREEAAVAAIEAETLTVEVAPPPDAVPAAPVAFGPNPASATPRADDNTAPFDLSEMEGPFAEQRLTVEEDPEDAFRDWVQSASTGVLKRALPELENRSEDDKALLVIERLARMEDSGVEFKTKLVDSLERLARTGPAVDACLALASALEMQDRRSEAREVYHRLLRLKPGHEEALVALELLGNVAEDQLLEEAVEIRPTPYMPDHVNATDSPGALNLPRATPAPNGHGASNGDADGGQGARPYSGVAGGAEASADFEQLLSEFRAELHHKPGDGNSTSRTELGASLKDMGRLDDAIRELQAAVREPSPPPLAFELLGEAFLEKGQGRIAIRLLEKAVGTLGSTDRELMGVLYQLGTAYEALTDANKALICYERIFSVDIDYRDIQERIIACST